MTLATEAKPKTALELYRMGRLMRAALKKPAVFSTDEVRIDVDDASPYRADHLHMIAELEVERIQHQARQDADADALREFEDRLHTLHGDPVTLGIEIAK